MRTTRERFDDLFGALEHLVATLDKSPLPKDFPMIPPNTIVQDSARMRPLLIQAISQAYAGNDAATQQNKATFYLTEAADKTVRQGDKYTYGEHVHATVSRVTPVQDDPLRAVYRIDVILAKNPVGPLPAVN